MSIRIVHAHCIYIHKEATASDISDKVEGQRLIRSINTPSTVSCSNYLRE